MLSSSDVSLISKTRELEMGNKFYASDNSERSPSLKHLFPVLSESPKNIGPWESLTCLSSSCSNNTTSSSSDRTEGVVS